MTLEFEQRGQTWVAREMEPSWPMALIARHIYYGTARLPLTLTLARDARGKGGLTTILTSHLDLLVAAQRRGFAKESATRLRQVVKGTETELQQSIMTMIDALLERLQAAQDEIAVVAVADVALPKDLTPRYALWPIVPEARAGMLVAPSMTGKSMTATMMSLTVCTEHIFIPALEPRDPGPVLYIGQEETAEQFAARVAMICRGHQIEVPRNLHYLKLKGGSLIDSAELLAEVAQTKHAKLIVIDSAQATWGAGGDNVREFASRWFNAVEQLGCPTLVIEHPNAEDTRKGVGANAAGTSVKRDRVGHQWQLKSVGIPPAPDNPWRYHVTLTDTKRNYVAQQADITYEVQIYRHEWVRFVEAGALTPETIVDSPSRTDEAIANVMRAEEKEDGWQVGDIIKATGAKDDRRTRQSLKAGFWRSAHWAPGIQYRFSQIEGTGTHPVHNPAMWVMDVERKPVQMTTAPGGADSPVNS